MAQVLFAQALQHWRWRWRWLECWPVGMLRVLRACRYFTIDSVAHASKRELLAVKGISEAKVEKLQATGDSCKWVACYASS